MNKINTGSIVSLILILLYFFLTGFFPVTAGELSVEPGFIQLNLKGEVVDSFFEVRVDDRGEIYLPLGRTLKVMELEMFNIEPEEGYVVGVIPQLRKEYFFDIESGSMQEEGETVLKVDSNSYFLDNGLLYLHYGVWEEWLSVTMDWQLDRYEMVVEPDFKLVSEIFAEREEELGRLDQEVVPEQDIVSPEPALFTPGLIHYYGSLSTNFQELNFPGIQIDYSGQLAYGDFTGGLRIRSDGTVNNHFQQRYFPSFVEELLIGDTRLKYPSVLSDRRSSVRGLTIRNIPDDFKFGQAEISGSVPPGSSVDLYYRNILVDYQESEAGEFYFVDVPVQGFANRYEVVVYTPEGNIYTEERRVISQPEQLTPGKLVYSLGLGLAEDRLLTAGEVNYGLFSNLSLGAGYFSLINTNFQGVNSVNDTNYANENIVDESIFNESTFNENNFEYLETVYEGNDDRKSTEVRQNFFKTGFSYRPFMSTGLYTDFYFSPGEKGFIYESELFHLFDNWFFTFDLEGFVDAYPPGREDRTISGQKQYMDRGASFSLRQREGDFNLSFDYDVEDYSGNHGHAVSLGSRLQPLPRMLITLAGEHQWGDFSPDRQEIKGRVFYSGLENNDLRADVELFFEEGQYLQSNLGLELTADRDDNFDYGLRLNYQNGKLRPGANLSYQLTDNLSVGGSVSTDRLNFGLSFGEVRRATPPFEKVGGSSSDRGVVEGRVFLDQAGTASWQEGEPVFSDVEILVDNSSEGIYTDEEGKFLIPDLAPYEPVSISINATGLDALQVPMQEEIIVETGPGTILRQDLPVVSVSGIDGFLNNFGELDISPGSVLINLLDQTGDEVLTVRPEFDGFYIIEGIKPGNYRLTLEVPENMDYEPQEYEVEIPPGAPAWLSGKSFTLFEK